MTYRSGVLAGRMLYAAVVVDESLTTEPHKAPRDRNPSESSSTEYYFWADNRPCFLCGYNEHFVGQVQPNEIGTSPEFAIGYSGNNTWGVGIVGVGSNFGGNWQSTN